ncbi:MAG: immune inhibitor A [Candidatus Aegiribacteria sp.]|nr:immune inhibitor A [Candidatus Aegiribacteria sp.]
MKPFLLALSFILAGILSAAPPIVHGAMPPLHERPSEGPAISGPRKVELFADSMCVCMIRVEFLEDFTEETSGNGKFDLDADPPHDRVYLSGIADGISNYYEGISGENLFLSFDIYPVSNNGAYQLSHQMIYYGSEDKFIEGACELLHDAVVISDIDIDFSLYDAVMVVHAGSGQEADIFLDSPGDIGSVFLTLMDLIYYLPGAGIYYMGIPTNDGVKVKEGMIVPEQETQDGFGLGVLGTMCHEFGHQLGLPDLYDTMTGHVGVGGWDIMGYGQWLMSGYWPSSLSAWSRMYLGWAPVIEFTDDGTFSLTQGDSILRIPLNSSEYLLIENRQRDPDGDGMCGINEHDFGLPGSGILIWHIDETRLGEYMNANMVNIDPDHKGVDLEEADGIQDFDYSLPDIYGYEGSEYDPWFQGGYAWIFSPSSEPSSDASWGGQTFVTVEVLDSPSNTMDITVTRSIVCEGWPVYNNPVKWGPVIWSDPDGDGDRLVVTTFSGYTRAYMPDGSGPELMGLGVSTPPVVGRLDEGTPLLLVCNDIGEIHLRDPEWNEPAGWPVTLPGFGVAVASFISSRLGAVVVADNNHSVLLFDAAGEQMDGWPVRTAAPVTGLAMYPDEDEPGIIAASADSRVYLWNTDGSPVSGWPVAPGNEDTGLPIAADLNRDGSADIVVVSGDNVFAYDRSGDLLPGFPAKLRSTPLSSPCFGDINSDGMLEIILTMTEGIAAIGASGATINDWPVLLEQDSLVYGYNRNRRGIGGEGFAMLSMDDGRICAFDEAGNQRGIFPVSVGDRPVGRPLLWDPDDTGNWRVAAADSSGAVYCWNSSLVPDGWFTGMQMSGENCWWGDDLPPVSISGNVLESGSFYVYPNPVRSGNGNIRFHPGKDSNWEIRIFNMGGDLVWYESGSAPGGASWEIDWDTRNLAPGVYFVNLYISNDEGSTEALFHAAVVH